MHSFQNFIVRLIPNHPPPLETTIWKLVVRALTTRRAMHSVKYRGWYKVKIPTCLGNSVQSNNSLKPGYGYPGGYKRFNWLYKV